MEAALSLSNRRLFLARHQQKVIASLIVRYVPDGIMEASGSCSYKESLSRSLGLHPNDLLHLRAIEWGCSQRLKSYSLGGTHLFLRKFGGPVLPNYRYRRDRTLLRTHTIRDIASELARIGAAHAPAPLVTLGRRFRDRVLH
jgi:hypothetical protein